MTAGPSPSSQSCLRIPLAFLPETHTCKTHKQETTPSLATVGSTHLSQPLAPLLFSEMSTNFIFQTGHTDGDKGHYE